MGRGQHEQTIGNARPCCDGPSRSDGVGVGLKAAAAPCKLAGIYKRPLAVFFLPEPPFGFQALRDFRRLPATEAGHWSPSLHAAIRRAHFQREVSPELHKTLGDEIPAPPRLSLFSGDRDRYAAAVREILGFSLETQRAWSEPREALAGWIAAVEPTGVLVLHAQRIELGRAPEDGTAHMLSY